MKNKTLIRLAVIGISASASAIIAPHNLYAAEKVVMVDDFGDEITFVDGKAGEDGSTITAANFEYDKLLGETMSEAFARELSYVSAKDSNGNEIKADDILINQEQKKAIDTARNGKHPLTFSTKGGATVTVTVTVYPLFMTVYADNFTYNTSNKSLTKELAKTLANAEVWSEDGETRLDIDKISVKETDLDYLNSHSAGTYDLTFTYDNAESATIKVEKSRNGTTISSNGTVNANTFSHLINKDTKPLTADQVKEMSNVSAVSKMGKSVNIADIQVNADELKAINEAPESGKYNLTFSIADGASKTIKVPVTVEEAKHDYYIKATDFSWNVNKQGNLSTANVIDLCNATFVTKDGEPVPDTFRGNVIVSKEDVAAINNATENGVYQITLSSTQVNSEGKVNVTVIAKGQTDLSSFTANAFTYNMADGELTAEKAKELAAIKITNYLGKEQPIDEVTVNESQLSTINSATRARTYKLTFTCPSLKKSSSVNVSVVPAETDDLVSTTIQADDFTYSLEDGELTADKVLAKSGAKLISKYESGKTAETQGEIVVNQTDLKRLNASTTSGECSLRLSSSSATSSKTISVNLIVNDVKPTVKSTEIVADNVTFNKKDGELTAEKLLSLAGAKVVQTLSDTTKYTLDEAITVDEEALRAAVATEETKSFDISLSSKSADNPKVITLTINVEKDVEKEPEVVRTEIQASGFDYDLSKSGTLSANQAIKLAGAKVVQTLSDASVKELDESITVNTTDLKNINNSKESGIFELKFTSPSARDGIAVKVNLKVDAVEEPEEGEATLEARNFEFDTTKSNLTASKARTLANVSATDEDGNSYAVSKIKVDSAQIKAINNATKSGDYPLTFSTDELKKEITVSVIVADSQAEITAKDFSFTRNGASSKLSEINARKLADVTALDINGDELALSDVIVNSAELDAINKATESGTFPLTFSIDDEVKTTINVKLTYQKDEDDEEDPDDEGSSNITAFDFTYDLVNGELTPAKARSYASVKAYDEKGNKIALKNISVDENELEELNSGSAGEIYDLTFITPDGTRKLVSVTLKDSSSAQEQLTELIKQLLESLFGKNVI